jgi:hypothetical protein
VQGCTKLQNWELHNFFIRYWGHHIKEDQLGRAPDSDGEDEGILEFGFKTGRDMTIVTPLCRQEDNGLSRRMV